MFTQAVAIGCAGWAVIIAIVTTIGTYQIFRHYSRPPQRPISSQLNREDVPHVTIIRPCQGLEPFLLECLAATFHQDYPSERVTVYFCVRSKSDAAYPELLKVLQRFPDHDARIYIEEEDPVVQGQNGGGRRREDFGPNPKIRNMSRAYREAKGDVIWILDCNIWLGYGALGRMVDKLCGFNKVSSRGCKAQTQKPYKLVAHLPVCVDVDGLSKGDPRNRSTSASASDDLSTVPLLSNGSSAASRFSKTSSSLTGSMLDAAFLSTAHAKMYVAINSVSIAPCINGKSTMFRKSHLNHLTQEQGIDYFSHNICEDHLIGDLLWKSPIPSTLGFDRTAAGANGCGGKEIRKSNPEGMKYRNHGLAMGDLAIQPSARMNVASYIARRVRWLRVRKYTVMLATLVEPGTESIVCSFMGAFAVTTIDKLKPIFGGSWLATASWFALSLCSWCVVDWFVSGVIQGMSSVETKDTISVSAVDQTTQREADLSNIVVPPFAKPTRRRFSKWLLAWLGREGLALSIWTWAIWGGSTVTWREKKFWVGMDMRVHEISSGQEQSRIEREGVSTKSAMKNGDDVTGNERIGTQSSNSSVHSLVTASQNGSTRANDRTTSNSRQTK